METFHTKDILIHIIDNSVIIVEIVIAAIGVYIVAKLINVDFHKKPNFKNTDAIQERIDKLKELNKDAKNAEKNMKIIQETLKKKSQNRSPYK